MNPPTLLSLERNYSLKRRHFYIGLVLLWSHLAEHSPLHQFVTTVPGLFFVIIIVMTVSDVFDGYMERLWLSNKQYATKFGSNWWQGLITMIFLELKKS
ncbi:MAG: hypothetical protein ACFFFG_10520 [Candidatus Thorarchaeota archaeon]